MQIYSELHQEISDGKMPRHVAESAYQQGMNKGGERRERVARRQRLQLIRRVPRIDLTVLAKAEWVRIAIQARNTTMIETFNKLTMLSLKCQCPTISLGP